MGRVSLSQSPLTHHFPHQEPTWKEYISKEKAITDSETSEAKSLITASFEQGILKCDAKIRSLNQIDGEDCDEVRLEAATGGTEIIWLTLRCSSLRS